MAWTDWILLLLFPAIWVKDRLVDWVSNLLWNRLCKVVQRALPYVMLTKRRHQELLDAEETLRAIDLARTEAVSRVSIRAKDAG